MFIECYLADTFKKLDWKNDVFDAEYLTKKTKEEREYEDVNKSLSKLMLNEHNNQIYRENILKSMDIGKYDVVGNMRRRFVEKIKGFDWQ